MGTSGFSFDDWIGEVYPAGIRKRDMLPFYERQLGFDALEVNYTYYTMPSLRTMESLSRRTSGNFSFVVKAHKSLTHERTDDVATRCRLFREGVRPLGGGLKALLFQFPYTFGPEKENIEYLRFLGREFEGYSSVAEFRNVRWAGERYLDLLRELGLGYCVVDEPKLRGLLPFIPALTSPVGYFRFHGRNTRWFREPVEVRYDYLYSEEELSGFVPVVKDVAEKAEITFAFFNNCHRGKAARNAQMFKEMLGLSAAGTDGMVPLPKGRG